MARFRTCSLSLTKFCSETVSTEKAGRSSIHTIRRCGQCQRLGQPLPFMLE